MPRMLDNLLMLLFAVAAVALAVEGCVILAAIIWHLF